MGSINVDGRECLRSEGLDSLRCLRELDAGASAATGDDTEDPVDTIVALHSVVMPKSSLSKADAGSIRSDISNVKPSGW
jgi:hypothetical protein